jgi:hemoglobin/transferrin/lactoferrin receptor protein
MTGIALSAPFWAQDPPPAPKPEKTVVVEAESPLNAPELYDAKHSADVVSRERLQNERMSRTLPEALEEVPGIQIQKTGPGQGSPVIRGFTGFRTLMLIDGIRLNNSTFREGPNQYWGTVDAFLAERIDIIRGPATVLYGSDAIGGTAYVHTNSPDVDAPGVNVHDRIYGRYASAEQSYGVREEFGGNAGGFGWIIGGTFRDMGDVVGGKHQGTMEGTAYDEYAVDAKFVWKTGERGKVIAAAQHFRQSEASRWHRTTDSASWHGTTPGTNLEDDFDQERNLYYLQYHRDSPGGVVDAVRASVSYQRMAEDEDRTFAGGATLRQYSEFSVGTTGAFLQMGKVTPLGYLTWGGEVYHDHVNSRRQDWNAALNPVYYDRGGIADEASYDLAGIYLQDEFKAGAFEAAGGIRYTYARAKADEVDANPGVGVDVPDLDETYDAFTGSLRFLVHVGEHWNVIAGWGQGFRAPTLDDSTSTNAFGSGSQDYPSPDLDPERTHTFDLGLRTQYSRVEFSGFGFYTLLEDYIVRVNKGDLDGDGRTDFAKDNFSDGYVYGYELAGRVNVYGNVWLFADWGYAKGEVEQVFPDGTVSEEPLPKMNASTLHAGIRWDSKPRRAWIEFLYTAVARQSHTALSEDAANDGQRIPAKHGTPGYTVYTLRGGYRICENATATAAVENISDKDYRVHGSGQNEPGTNFVLGLDLRF